MKRSIGFFALLHDQLARDLDSITREQTVMLIYL